ILQPQIVAPLRQGDQRQEVPEPDVDRRDGGLVFCFAGYGIDAQMRGHLSSSLRGAPVRGCSRGGRPGEPRASRPAGTGRTGQASLNSSIGTSGRATWAFPGGNVLSWNLDSAEVVCWKGDAVVGARSVSFSVGRFFKPSGRTV